MRLWRVTLSESLDHPAVIVLIEVQIPTHLSMDGRNNGDGVLVVYDQSHTESTGNTFAPWLNGHV